MHPSCVWFDVHLSDLTTVLSCVQIRTSPVVRIIKAKACRPWGKRNAAHSMRGNKWWLFFRRAIQIWRNELSVPMQLFWRVWVVVNLNRYCWPSLNRRSGPGN